MVHISRLLMQISDLYLNRQETHVKMIFSIHPIPHDKYNMNTDDKVLLNGDYYSTSVDKIQILSIWRRERHGLSFFELWEAEIGPTSTNLIQFLCSIYKYL